MHFPVDEMQCNARLCVIESNVDSLPLVFAQPPNSLLVFNSLFIKFGSTVLIIDDNAFYYSYYILCKF